MDVKPEVISRYKEVFDQMLKGKNFNEDDLPQLKEGGLPEELDELFHSIKTLINNLSEMNRFAMHLCKGEVDAEPPGRRNYLAGNLKQLHAQLSSLTWGMEQLVKGNIVSKLYDNGKLYESFNGLVDKVAAAASGLDRAAPGEWDWAVNSWRHHQILAALNNLHIMVVEVAEDGKILYANRPAKDYLGDLERLGLDIDMSGHSALLRQMVLSLEPGNAFPHYKEFQDKETGGWYKITSNRVSLTEIVNGYLLMVDDISEWKHKESNLRITAVTDALTGTLNRAGGLQALEDALRQQASGLDCCAAFVDVDGLKAINDRFGHNEGDFAIRSIANALLDSVREKDIVCRYGGDEFLLVFFGCRKEAAERALVQAGQKLAELNSVLVDYKLDFSHGTTNLPAGDKQDIPAIIEQMDTILYAQKSAKKNNKNRK